MSYNDYIRLLRGLKPKVFVAENVSGLIKGTAKGMFLEILSDLKSSGYRVKCKVLDAQWLGVPQMRQRTIFVGVREDLGKEPVHPKPLSYRYTVRDALPWIAKIVQDPKGQFAPQTVKPDSPCFTIKAGSASHVHIEPETNIDKYAIGREWEKLRPGEQSDRYFSCVKVDPNKPSPMIQASHGAASIAQPLHPAQKRKFAIGELKRICSFPEDFILTGSYARQWERLGNSVPPVMMFHIASAIRDGILLQAS